MREFFKKNFAIVIAFSLPILLILSFGLSVYIPSLFLSTDYNFVYVACVGNSRNFYYCDSTLKSRYSVVRGKLVENKIDPNQDLNNNNILDINEQSDVGIFLHNTKTNVSRGITLEEAKTLNISPIVTSPDGVTVIDAYSRGSSDFFFFYSSGSNYDYYMSKGNSKKKLNLINSGHYYNDGFRFIGWVLPNQLN